jgi:hypothetical protein
MSINQCGSFEQIYGLSNTFKTNSFLNNEKNRYERMGIKEVRKNFFSPVGNNIVV